MFRLYWEIESIQRELLQAGKNLVITHHLIAMFKENLTVKENEIAFLGRKFKGSGHVDKIYTKEGVMHVSSPEIHRGKVLKIDHINYLFSLFPYMILERIMVKMNKTFLHNPDIYPFFR